MDRYIDRLTDITNRTKWYIMIHMLWICECSNGSSPWCLRRVSQINFECLSTACSFNRGWDLFRMSPSSQLEYVRTYPTWGHRAKELKEPTRHAVTLCYSQFNRRKRATDHRVTFSGAGWIPRKTSQRQKSEVVTWGYDMRSLRSPLVFSNVETMKEDQKQTDPFQRFSQEDHLIG